MTAIEIIRTKYKLNDEAISRNIQELCLFEWTEGQYLAGIAELRGDRSKIEHLKEQALQLEEARAREYLPKYAFRYFVYNLLKTPEAAVEEMYTKGIDDAIRYMNNSPWVFAKPEEDVAPKLNADGTVAPKKGDKKVIAKKLYEDNKGKITARKDWIALLVKEVGLTEAGASTYYANLKNGKY